MVAAFPPNFGALWGTQGSHKLGWKKASLLAELCKLPGQAGFALEASTRGWRPEMQAKQNGASTP